MIIQKLYKQENKHKEIKNGIIIIYLAYIVFFLLGLDGKYSNWRRIFLFQNVLAWIRQKTNYSSANFIWFCFNCDNLTNKSRNNFECNFYIDLVQFKIL